VLQRPPEQFTSWAFGRRLRDAGLLGSMGTVGDCYDNSMMESFFGTLQLELLDEHTWAATNSRPRSSNGSKAGHDPTRRHTSINDRSPAEFETLHHLTATAA